MAKSDTKSTRTAAKKEPEPPPEPEAITTAHGYAEAPSPPAAGGPPASTDKREPLTDLNTLGVNEATPGQFVEVAKGEHKGRYAAFLEVSSYKGGQPETATIRTRDADSAILVVKYDELVPSEAGKR